MSALQTVRKKIQGDFFLEKSYKNGKLFYEVLRYKDDYIGINYGYLDDELREETYINDNRIGMVIVNEKAIVRLIIWHEKDRRIYYILDVEGNKKRSNSWYYEDENKFEKIDE